MRQCIAAVTVDNLLRLIGANALAKVPRINAGGCGLYAHLLSDWLTQNGIANVIRVAENPTITVSYEQANTVDGIYVPYDDSDDMVAEVLQRQPSLDDARRRVPGIFRTVDDWGECGIQCHHISLAVPISNSKMILADASSCEQMDASERVVDGGKMILYRGEVGRDELSSMVVHMAGWNHRFRAQDRASLMSAMEKVCSRPFVQQLTRRAHRLLIH